MTGNGCAIMADGRAYRPEILNLHRRFFYGEGHNLHTHPEYHLILVSQGKCELLQPNRAPVVCPTNSLVLINPNWPHTFRTGLTDGVEHTCMIFSLVDAAGTQLTVPLQRFFDQPGEPGFQQQLLSESDADDFAQRVARAAALLPQGGFAAEVACFDIIIRGMLLAFPKAFALKPQINRQHQLTAEVRAIVEERLNSSDLSLSMIARQLQLHPNYLNKLFTEVEKMPIGNFIIYRRLLRARQLLAGSRQIKDVARLCGFASQNYFTRIFRRRFGCTPTEYRSKAHDFRDAENA